MILKYQSITSHTLIADRYVDATLQNPRVVLRKIQY